MKQLFFTISLMFVAREILIGQTSWHVSGDKIRSSWADSVDVYSVLPDYPRPQLRKISIAPDAAGIQKMMLNSEFLFQFGALDQGW